MGFPTMGLQWTVAVAADVSEHFLGVQGCMQQREQYISTWKGHHHVFAQALDWAEAFFWKMTVVQ